MRLRLRRMLLLLSPGLMGAMLIVPRLPLYLNSTPSIPLGIYCKTADSSAPYMAFHLPEKARGFPLRAEWSESSVFLKPVIRATKQHPLTFTPQGFYCDGRLLPNTAPKAQSLNGKPFGHYPFGTWTSGKWAISTYNRDSFDSRYWGPVEDQKFIAYVKPLL